MPDKELVHSYFDERFKCPKCNFYNRPQNVLKHINSVKNLNGKLCDKYKTEYSNWYYLKIR